MSTHRHTFTRYIHNVQLIGIFPENPPTTDRVTHYNTLLKIVLHSRSLNSGHKIRVLSIGLVFSGNCLTSDIKIALYRHLYRW